MTTEQSLQEQSPRQIDEQLADLYREQLITQHSLQRSYVRLHELAEPELAYGRGKPQWTLTHNEAHKKVVASLGELSHWDKQSAEYTIIEFAKAKLKLKELAEQAAPLNDEYERRPWSRFFLVTSSNGHIHKDMQCSTCFPRTEYGWLPSVSGKTEKEAVEEHGTRLCTVCFPSAPVEWTVGFTPVKEGNCSGQGQPAVEGSVKGESNRWGDRYTYTAVCPECQHRVRYSQGKVQISPHKLPKKGK